MLFDSITTFSARSISLRIRGIASDKSPCRVLTQNDRTAPAARYLPVSVELSPPTRSSLTARVCSAVSQSHGSPLAEHIPCPNCVILNAVQCISGSAAISPATTLVFPIFRVCPPTTTIAIATTQQTTTKHQSYRISAVSAEQGPADTPSKAAPASPRTPHPAPSSSSHSTPRPHLPESP